MNCRVKLLSQEVFPRRASQKVPNWSMIIILDAPSSKPTGNGDKNKKIGDYIIGRSIGKGTFGKGMRLMMFWCNQSMIPTSII